MPLPLRQTTTIVSTNISVATKEIKMPRNNMKNKKVSNKLLLDDD